MRLSMAKGCISSFGRPFYFLVCTGQQERPLSTRAPNDSEMGPREKGVIRKRMILLPLLC